MTEQFRQVFEAHFFAAPEEDIWPDERPDVAEALVHARWQLLRYDVLVNAGENPLVFADDTDADLGHLTSLLVDDNGSLREELHRELGETGFESALLYIDSIEFAAGVDTYKMGMEVIEHLIRHDTAGCFGAVYYRGAQEVPDVGLERALRFLQFKKLGTEPVYFANLELKRPELPSYSDQG